MTPQVQNLIQLVMAILLITLSGTLLHAHKNLMPLVQELGRSEGILWASEECERQAPPIDSDPTTRLAVLRACLAILERK